MVRLRLRGIPLERDEGEYAYFGQLLLHGVAPYAGAYSMKFPGIFGAYALIEGVFGQTATAIRLGLLVVNLATLAFVFLLGRRLAGDAEGAIAAASFGLMSVSASVLGFAAHATQFVVLFAVAGLVVLLEAIDRDRVPLFAASGVLLGLAYTMKQHGVVFALFGGLWLLIAGARRDRIAVYAAGVLAPFVAIVIALAAAGVLGRFWFWDFVYAARYVSSDTLAHRLDNLTLQLRAMRPLAGFAAVALAGLAVPAWDATRRRPVLFAFGLAGFSVAAIVPGFFFRAHYFVQLIPAVALLTGIAIAAIGRRFRPLPAAALLVAASAVMIVSEERYLFRLAPDAIAREVYAGNPFPEAVVVGDYLRANTRPGDKILVLGSEPEIYFYARRRGASGHIYMYGLMEEHPYARRMQQELAAEAEAARPEIVVLVGTSTSWLRGPRSAGDVFAWAKSFLAASYERVGVVTLGDPPRATWGPEAAGLTPEADRSLLVFRRR